MENTIKDKILGEIKIQIDEGQFDEHLTLPFMNKKLLFAAFKGRIERKEEKETALTFSEAEVKNTIEAAKEAAGGTFYLMVKNGILEPNAKGGYQLSIKGARAIREISQP